jgi:hypothetical protein
MRRDRRRAAFWNEDVPDLPDPGSPVRTEVQVNYHKGVWSLARKPDKNSKTFHATWRYPSVRLWRKLKRYNENYEHERECWRHLLLNCSFVSPITLEEEKLSQESYRKILEFYPGMIPAALLRKYLETTHLTNRELLRIERECYTLWTTENASLKNPHPILGDVVWSMSLHEHFGIQLWGNLEDLHIKIYAVMRKALECYASASSINMSAMEARRRAQELTGVGPGGVVRRGR